MDNGYRKIAHIRGPFNLQNVKDRFTDYKKALEINNIPFNASLMYILEEGIDFAK